MWSDGFSGDISIAITTEYYSMCSFAITRINGHSIAFFLSTYVSMLFALRMLKSSSVHLLEPLYALLERSPILICFKSPIEFHCWGLW